MVVFSHATVAEFDVGGVTVLQIDSVPSLDKPACLIIWLCFGFASDTICQTKKTKYWFTIDALGAIFSISLKQPWDDFFVKYQSRLEPLRMILQTNLLQKFWRKKQTIHETKFVSTKLL